jgi:hypothetical protein
MCKDRDEIQAKLDVINDEIAERKSQTLVQCTDNNHGEGCGMGFKICELEYIQTHYYVSPHGCNGGDYWLQGEGNFDCPSCGHRNRLYDRPDIQKLKSLFKSVRDEHE